MHSDGQIFPVGRWFCSRYGIDTHGTRVADLESCRMTKQERKMIRKMISLLLLAGFTGGLLGCNTMRGLGQDVERGGEKIQQESRDAQRK